MKPSKHPAIPVHRLEAPIPLGPDFGYREVSGMGGAAKENPIATQVWDGLHCLSGFLFVIFGTFHIVYNWKALTYYLKRK